MSKAKTFFPVVALGVLASALAATASSKTWAVLDARDAQLVGSLVGSSGELPLASALSLAALASWGALLVSRGRWRRWIALLGLVIALGSLVTAIVGYSKAPSDVRHDALPALGVLSSPPGLTGWYWAALIADLLVVATLVIAVRDAPTWPSMSARYDSPTGAKGAAAKVGRPRTSLDVWKALDQGDDPTESSDGESTDASR